MEVAYIEGGKKPRKALELTVEDGETGSAGIRYSVGCGQDT